VGLKRFGFGAIQEPDSVPDQYLARFQNINTLILLAETNKTGTEELKMKKKIGR
jgi:hypothetical protein